jgi:hypothetical protein
VLLAVSYLMTAHWLEGSSTLFGVLALFAMLYERQFKHRFQRPTKV